jgi:hypothetical protein
VLHPAVGLWPRVSITSNQWRLRTVSEARATARWIASSMLLSDEPTSSITL